MSKINADRRSYWALLQRAGAERCAAIISAQRPRCFAAQGFTLLEMTVVLLITAMITTILMQWLHQTYRLQQVFGREIFNSQNEGMYAEWFRQSVNGTLPDTLAGPNRFKGTARQFSGLTLSPVDSAVQAVQPFAWRLQFNPSTGRTQLLYGLGQNAPEISSWPGDSGHFSYIDQAGKTSQLWPPPFGQPPQLPAAVMLQTLQADMPKVIVAVPRGLQNPLPRRRDLRD